MADDVSVSLTARDNYSPTMARIAENARKTARDMATLENQAGAWPADGVPLREFRFVLEGGFETQADVAVQFHCPADRALWVYDWALLLA